jgi:diacylglycerol kinase family enzyme
MLGPFAYAIGALRAGLATAPIDCEVRCDGERLFSGRAWQVTVGLTGAFGGGAEVDADPRDGLLDVVVIEARSRLRLLAHAYGMRAGSVEDQRGVVTGSGREIEVITDGRAGFNIDGELVEAKRLRLSLRPRAFDVVVG